MTLVRQPYVNITKSRARQKVAGFFVYQPRLSVPMKAAKERRMQRRAGAFPFVSRLDCHVFDSASSQS